MIHYQHIPKRTENFCPLKNLQMNVYKKHYMQQTKKWKQPNCSSAVEEFNKMLYIHKMEYYAQSLQLCPTLCHPMDWSPLGFSVHGILQERTLEWVAISSSRGSSQKVSRGNLILKMNENVSQSIIKVDEAHHCHNRIYFMQSSFLI